MAANSNLIDITLYLAGTDEDDAQLNMHFDSEDSAYSWSTDNPGTEVFAVSAVVDLSTIRKA